jgi:hypothetical protein
VELYLYFPHGLDSDNFTVFTSLYIRQTFGLLPRLTTRQVAVEWLRHKYNDKEIVMSVFTPYDRRNVTSTAYTCAGQITESESHVAKLSLVVAPGYTEI